KRLDHIRVPTILINSQAESQDNLLHWVAVDDPAGAQLAVEHLLQLGHRSIGYLGVSCRPRSNQQRLQGYQNALGRAGMSCRDDWIVIAPGTVASHAEDVIAGQAWLLCLLDPGITAIVCYNVMFVIRELLVFR